MLNAPEYCAPPGGGLERIEPGIYVDDAGREYFYLTGLYPLVAARIAKFPLRTTEAFAMSVLEGLRRELQDRNCKELMD
jgi:hypothetical protein